MSGPLAIGYWASWLNIASWYSADYPGQCQAGCQDAPSFISMATNYSTINYSFALMSQNWYSGYDPSQLCQPYNRCGNAGGCPNCENTNTWPAQDGSMALYWIAKCRGAPAFSPFIDQTTTAGTPTPAILVSREIGRLSHQHPTSPKAFNMTIGGWSDCITLNKDYVEDLAQIVTSLVLQTFADGVDLDVEHMTQLSPYSSEGPYRSDADRAAQLEAFALFVIALRNSLDNLTANPATWEQNLDDTDTWLDSVQGQCSADYYNSNKAYIADLKRLAAIKAPTFTISYTGRFNVFLNSTVLGFPAPFKTDQEGGYMAKNFPGFLESIDYVNLMIYDVDFPGITPTTYAQVYSMIIKATIAAGVPANKIVCGMEPGIQAGSAEAPDQTPSVPAIIDLVKTYGTLGVMFWAVNTTNNGSPFPQSVVDAIGSMGAKDKYNNGDFTKTNPSGWISSFGSQTAIKRSIGYVSNHHYRRLLRIIAIIMLILLFWLIVGKKTVPRSFIFVVCGICALYFVIKA